MALQVIPEWIVNLEDEDVSFIKRFLLASGSLKEMARQYKVTYPTAILLAIYWNCRGRQSRNKQLEKMNIQDLG